MAEQWYKRSFRRTLLDMHIPDWNPEFLSRYDPEEYFRMLKTAEISTVMIYVHAHTGLCYWPTASGTMHKAFYGREDMIRRLFKLCRADGISTILYYSLVYNTEEYFKHPDWRMRSSKGEGSMDRGSRYGLLCPNNAGYRAFLRKQIREFSEYFDFDGIFFDMTFWPMVCYCDACRKRWENEAGGEMPVIADWNDPRWRLFARKREEWIGEFAHYITDTAKEAAPHATVEHQCAPSMQYWRFGHTHLVEEASDYIGADLYGGIEEQSFACKAWYNMTKNRPFQYMTSRCYPSLAEHTTTKSHDLLKLCASVTYAHHGASFMIDAIDPVGTVDRRVYERIGSIFRELKPYEPYLTRGKMRYDAAILYDQEGKMDADRNGLPAEDHFHAQTVSARPPHLHAALGAARALRRFHVPYGVVTEYMTDEEATGTGWLRDVKVLIVPDDPGISDELSRKIADYVREGGALYFSAHSSHPYLMEEFFGIRTTGRTEETVTYVQPEPGGEVLLGEFTRKYPLPMQEAAFTVEMPSRGRVLATLNLPYSVPTPGNTFPMDWEDSGMPHYTREQRYGSIHSNPPGVSTTIPAIIEAEYGKGHVVWSALPVEKPKIPQHEEVFSRIISLLMDGRPAAFTARAGSTVELVLFDDAENTEKLLSVLNLQEDFETMPAIDIDVHVLCSREPREVVLLPSEEKIPFTYADGYACWHIDILRQFEMYLIRG